MYKTHDPIADAERHYAEQDTYDSASEYWTDEIDNGFANRETLPYIGRSSYGSYGVKYQTFDEAVHDLMDEVDVCEAFMSMLRHPQTADISALMSVMKSSYKKMWLEDLINHTLGR